MGAKGIMQSFCFSSPGLAAVDELIDAEMVVATALAMHQAHKGRAIRAYGDADQAFERLPFELQRRVLHTMLQVLVPNRKGMHPWHQPPRQQPAQQGEVSTEGAAAQGAAPAMQGRPLVPQLPRRRRLLLPRVLQLQTPSPARQRTAACVLRTPGCPRTSPGTAYMAGSTP